jgi:hypothetical protein
MAQDHKERRYEVPLDGKLITGDDPAKIGPNFQSLINLRYSNKHPKAIGGMTKINSVSNSYYPHFVSGIHYRKSQPVESHVLAEAYDPTDSTKIIGQNITAIPNAGLFESDPVYSPAAGSDNGRWSLAPNGDVAYCNGLESCIWGGNEMEIGGFINYLNEVSAGPVGTAQNFTVDVDTDILTTGGLVQQTGGAVEFYTDGVLPSPLVIKGVHGLNIYYVNRISDTEYTVHSNSTEAYYGILPINITDVGSGQNTITPVLSSQTATNQSMYDYTDQLRNTSTDTDKVAVLQRDTDESLYFYIGSIRPLNGFTPYLLVVNTSPSTMAVDYWSGSSWTTCTNIVDDTSIGGISLAQK